MANGTLEVIIVEGRNLKDCDIISENDPYVEIYLNKKYRQRTRVVKNCKNPVWNERFTFNIYKGDDTIYFDVFDDDLIGRDFIGNGKMKLRRTFDENKFEDWIQLPSRLHLKSHGEIHIIMTFTPS